MGQVVRIFQREFEEFGGSHGRVDGVIAGNGSVEHVDDTVWFLMFAVNVNCLQCFCPFCFISTYSLKMVNKQTAFLEKRIKIEYIVE